MIALGNTALNSGAYTLAQNVLLAEEPGFEFEFTLMGIYSDPGNLDPNEQSGVSVTLDNSAFSDPVGVSFDNYFNVSNGGESAIQLALSSGDTAALNTFYQDNYGNGVFVRGFPASGTQYDFTLGNVSGIAAAAVPEPSSLTLAGLAGALLVLRRCRS